MKTCKKCLFDFPDEDFYLRKDNNGEHTMLTSYCKQCSSANTIEWRKNTVDYKEHNRKKFAKYYAKNKEAVKITQKRYYYNKLSPEKKIKFKERLMKTKPELVEIICKET